MRKTILAMALLASMTAMAQENAKVDVHARYTKVVTPVDGKYESKRPPVEDRLFTSTAVEKKIKEVQKLLKKNPKLAWMFANCYPNTLESTVHYRVLENGDDDTFVYTGDIPAMWLRDSGAQVWPYVARQQGREAEEDAEGRNSAPAEVHQHRPLCQCLQRWSYGCRMGERPHQDAAGCIRAQV